MRTNYSFEDAIIAAQQKYKNFDEFKRFMLKCDEFHKAFKMAKEKEPNLNLEKYLDDFFEKAQKVGKMIGLI